MAKLKTIFETETCSRCGGTGQYSYCSMYGRTCFRCSGRMLTYTKRGHAAAMYYQSLCSLPLEQLEVGMEVWRDSDSFGRDRGGWSKITDIHPDALNPGMITVQCGDQFSRGAYAGHIFRVRQSPDKQREKQSLAMIYQRSLTKSGKLDTRLIKLMTQIAYA